MRILTWNVRRAGTSSPVWDYLREIDPCVAFLQEVSQIPEDVIATHHVAFGRAVRKTGRAQSFGNVIISKYPIDCTDSLFSDVAWVNDLRSFYAGNLLVRRCTLPNSRSVTLLNVYSPAWAVPEHLTDGIDLTGVILTQNPKLWCTEIIWKLLADSSRRAPGDWIVGGDFNSSETFDYFWGKKPRGNKELADRLNALGLWEALRERNGQLVPTFRSPRNGTTLHQMDHLYMSRNILSEVERCFVPKAATIFDCNLSDHLPIIAELKM